MSAVSSSLLEVLECPRCSGALTLERQAGAEQLACAQGHSFPVVRGVPRFVPTENYAGNFGYQWLKFSKTQLDSHTGLSISRDRFFRQTGWRPDELRGKRVLDAGCGAGRFTEIALDAGAWVTAFDYSAAVDACYANHSENPRFSVIQADIYDLPLRSEAFDFIYCFGVLQHTPDPRGAFSKLPRLVKPGGRVAVDAYRKHWANAFAAKYWLRPFLSRLPSERLFQLVEKWVPRLLPFSDMLAALPGGRYLRRMVPVANYRGMFPMNERQLREWSLLDTFDWFGPRYDKPQRAGALREWFRAAGLERVEVLHVDHLTARGTKPFQHGLRE